MEHCNLPNQGNLCNKNTISGSSTIFNVLFNIPLNLHTKETSTLVTKCLRSQPVHYREVPID